MQVSFIRKSIVATVGAVALVGAIAPRAAQAATLTHISTPISFDNLSLSAGNTKLFLPYFDAAQGILNSVTYGLTGNPYAEVTLKNTSPSPALNSGPAIASIASTSFFRPSGLTLGTGFIQGYADTGSVSLSQGQQATAIDSYLVSSVNSSSAPSAFIGTGNFDVWIFSYFQLTGGGANGVSIEGLAGINSLVATVTYDYRPTSVPTPALLPGLIGLGLMRKRRSKKSPLAPQFGTGIV
jgi:hypothetical protein